MSERHQLRRAPAGIDWTVVLALAFALPDRHCASKVGKSKLVLLSSADPVAAVHCCSLAYWVGRVATGVHADPPSAQPRMAMTKYPGPMFDNPCKTCVLNP